MLGQMEIEADRALLTTNLSFQQILYEHVSLNFGVSVTCK